MNKKLLFTLAAFVAIVLASGFGMMYPTGAPVAKTGSPGDGSNCTECHGGSPTTTPGQITSNIPATGYTPGQTYQITATNPLTGSGSYGFEVSPQNAAGTQLGTLASGAGSKLVGGTKYVTHSNANSTTNTWTFNWTAPVAGTGAVTFYGAFAKNKPGPVTLSTLVVQEAAAAPAAAGPITGPASVCKNNSANYSVGTIVGATTYNWTVPAGATIQSGQGTTTISVMFGNSANSGNVSVYGSNTAGNGAASNIAVSIKTVPAAPSAVLGSTAPCQASAQTYSVNNISGVTYTWSIPSGWNIVSGQGTNTLNVTVGNTSGSVSVLPSNTCGDGLASTISTVVGLAAQTPAAPTGPMVVDVLTISSTEYSTSSPNADTYTWQLLPAEAGTITGTGSTATATWSTTYTGPASISAKGINECGESAWSAVATTQIINTTGLDDEKQTIRILPSVIEGSFTLVLNTEAQQSKIRIFDMSGRLISSNTYPGIGTFTVTNQMNKGLYIVVVEAGVKILNQKVVIR